MAFIFQSPKSKFWIAGFIDRDGRRRNRSTRTTDRRKALKIAEDFETAWRGQLTARQFERVLTEGIERITGETRLNTPFDAFLKDWLSARKAEWAPSSLARAETVLERFADHLGELARRPMRGITRADVTAFRNAELGRISPATVNFELKLIKMVFKAARRDGAIQEDPSEHVDTVKLSRSERSRRPFTLEELRAVLDACDQEWRSMVLFALYTGGQRLSDVAALTWANVDLQRKEVRFETRKTGRRVIIPLVGPLLRHAESLPAGISPADPIHPRAFQTLKAQGRTNTLSNQFDTILSQAGLKAYGSHQGVGKGRATKRDTGKLGFHALRMTATTLMHDAGIPAATVQAIVGHESEDVHRLYIRMGRESQERALSVLPDLA